MDPNQLGEVRMFSNQTVGAEFLVYLLLGLTCLVGIIIYATYRYKRYKKMQEFNNEMSQVGLSADEESALTGLVKQYALQEPVQILLSLRMFDDLACQEISRILGSPGSTVSKDRFVQMIYDIRKKTYFPDWDKKQAGAEEENKEAPTAENSSNTHANNLKEQSPVMS